MLPDRQPESAEVVEPPQHSQIPPTVAMTQLEETLPAEVEVTPKNSIVKTSHLSPLPPAHVSSQQAPALMKKPSKPVTPTVAESEVEESVSQVPEPPKSRDGYWKLLS